MSQTRGQETLLLESILILGAIMAATQGNGQALKLWLPIILIGVAFTIRFTTNRLDDIDNKYEPERIEKRREKAKWMLIRRIVVYITYLSFIFAIIFAIIMHNYKIDWVNRVGIKKILGVFYLGILALLIIKEYLVYVEMKKINQKETPDKAHRQNVNNKAGD